MSARTNRTIAALAAAMLAGAGCTGGQPPAVADKVGSETVVLRLATIDGTGIGPNVGPDAFVASLASTSGGRLKVEVAKSYGSGAADAESRLVEAIASGAIDGGWPSTRAFSRAGISGLEAVEAPLTISSYGAEKALVEGPIAAQLLDKLAGSGVVGLGLAVGPLRRPFAAGSPLLGPEDWRGIRFRAYNSPVQADAIRALGATPVDVGTDWVRNVIAGDLRGAEFDIKGYADNGMGTEAGNVTANIVLWPKVHVLSVSQSRYDALTQQQRAWVRQAAQEAVKASVDATHEETSAARELCGRGVRFAMASEAELAALRAAVAPVVDKLAADPSGGAILRQIQALAAEDGTVEAPDVPSSCLAAPEAPVASMVPNEVSSLPSGVYRVEISLQDVEAAGLSNGPGWTGTWTLTIEEGTYVLTCRALDDPGRDCGNNRYEGPLEAGHLRGTGDTVYFVFDVELMAKLTGCKLPPSSSPDHCHLSGLYWMTWQLEGDRLTFSNPGGVPAHDKEIKPWRKIG